MYQLVIILIVVTLLSGCESLQREKFLEASNELLGRAGAAFKGIGQQEPGATSLADFSSELQPLFAQPYIDPLTRYLNLYEGDESRAGALAKVRQERDQRCAVIANRYAARPISQEALNLYRVGYLFSCPQDVNAYAQRLEKLQAENNAKEGRDGGPENTNDPQYSASIIDSARSAGDTTSGDVADLHPSQQLSDCYLLTTIRNFSGATKACLQPAEAGDVQAQTNMAVIAHSLRDYTKARHWALRAAPESGVASYLLGQMYMAGNGVEQNRLVANEWYTNAAEQGHAEAKAALEEHRDGVSDGEAVN